MQENWFELTFSVCFNQVFSKVKTPYVFIIKSNFSGRYIFNLYLVYFHFKTIIKTLKWMNRRSFLSFIYLEEHSVISLTFHCANNLYQCNLKFFLLVTSSVFTKAFSIHFFWPQKPRKSLNDPFFTCTEDKQVQIHCFFMAILLPFQEQIFSELV